MSLSPTVSEMNGDFSRKSQILPTRVFNANAEYVPLELGNTGRPHVIKDLEDDDIFSRLHTVHERVTNVTHRQTDRQTDAGRQQRSRLRIESVAQ